MNRLRKAVRDYLMMRRGLALSWFDMSPDCGISYHSWHENEAHASP